MIKTAELLKVLNEHRGDAIVIPGRGGRHWVPISKHPELDIPLGRPVSVIGQGKACEHNGPEKALWGMTQEFNRHRPALREAEQSRFGRARVVRLRVGDGAARSTDHPDRFGR